MALTHSQSVNQVRSQQIKQQGIVWAERAAKDGLIFPNQPLKQNRSQVEAGVSIDFLARFAASIRDLPLIPTDIITIINTIIHAATAERNCKFIDLLHPDHVGYASLVVSYTHKGDFLELISTLVNDFESRWDAHVAYRTNRKESALDRASMAASEADDASGGSDKDSEGEDDEESDGGKLDWGGLDRSSSDGPTPRGQAPEASPSSQQHHHHHGKQQHVGWPDSDHSAQQPGKRGTRFSPEPHKPQDQASGHKDQHQQGPSRPVSHSHSRNNQQQAQASKDKGAEARSLASVHSLSESLKKVKGLGGSGSSGAAAAAALAAGHQRRPALMPSHVANLSPALLAERKKMLGYYVWIDCMALAQAAADVMQMSRLIHVVGRTALVLDDRLSCLQRLWCLWEVWCTVKHKRLLLTLSTSSLQSLMANRDEEEEDEEKQETGPAVTPKLELMQAATTLPEDRLAILAQWQAEISSTKGKLKCLGDICALIHGAVVEARAKEQKRADLVAGTYAGLALCSRIWRGVLAPEWRDINVARVALKRVVEVHFARELAKAKGMQAAFDQDAELELWQLLMFLTRALEANKDEQFWVAELQRFGNMAHRSFATRFSKGYVDNLLRASGTFNDMKVLREYVYSQCKERTIRSGRSAMLEDGEDEGQQ